MKNHCHIFRYFRTEKLVFAIVVSFTILFVGENVMSFFDLNQAENLELSENQEEESKSSSEKELEDIDKLVQYIEQHQFAAGIKLSSSNHHIDGRVLSWSLVETPPPELI